MEYRQMVPGKITREIKGRKGTRPWSIEGQRDIKMVFRSMAINLLKNQKSI